MAWVALHDLGRMHREKYPQTSLSPRNMEHAVIELFGFPCVLRENVLEALSEFERREMLLRSLKMNHQGQMAVNDAKTLFRSVRGSLFSDNWWEMFLLKRTVSVHYDYYYYYYNYHGSAAFQIFFQ